MSSQTDHLSNTTTAGQVTGSSEHGLVASILISIFSPSGPSGDWLKLFVIGGLLELMRRFILSIWKGLVNQFWITIVLEEYDDSYSKSDLFVLLSRYEPNESRSRSLDDVMAIKTNRMDTGQGIIDQ